MAKEGPDLTGQVFGRLTITSMDPPKRNRKVTVRCTCGTVKKVLVSELKRGRTTSCGCYNRERLIQTLTTHGDANKANKTAEYRAWGDMLCRCTNPTHRQYPDYGGRGIKVCCRWAQYANFLTDMGRKPSNTSLDRKNNNKGYCPSNCRWATPSQQQNNKRNTCYITYAGKIRTRKEWATIRQINPNTITSRLRRGWTIAQTLNFVPYVPARRCTNA